MEIDQVKFGFPGGIGEIQGLSLATTLMKDGVRAACFFTNGISEVPTAKIAFSVNQAGIFRNIQTSIESELFPGTFTDQTTLSQWSMQQAFLQFIAYETPDSNFKVQISGLVTKITASHNNSGDITAITLDLISWPGAKGTVYTKGYRFFQNNSSIEIAKQIFEDAGGTVKIHEATHGPFRNSFYPPRRNYEVQYGESDIEFIKRILAEDGLLFSINYEQTSSYFPDDTPAPVLSIYQDFRENTEVNLTVADSSTGTIGLRNGLYDFKCKKNHAADEIAIAAGLKNVSGIELRKTTLGENPENRSRWVEVDVNSDYESQNPFYGDRLENLTELIAGSNTAPLYEFGYDSACLNVGNSYALSGINIDARRQGRIAVLKTEFSLSKDSGDLRYLLSAKIVCKSDIAPHYVKPPPRPSLPGVLRAVVLSDATQLPYPQTGENTVNADTWGRIQVRILWHGEARAADPLPTQARPWLRLMTPWAGQGAGVFALPRAGQEVIVSFVNGDASQPIVMGCMYGDTALDSHQSPWATSASNGHRDESSWAGIGTHRPSDAHKGQHIRLDGVEKPVGIEMNSVGNIDIKTLTDVKMSSKSLDAKNFTGNINFGDYQKTKLISIKSNNLSFDFKDTKGMIHGDNYRKISLRKIRGDTMFEKWNRKNVQTGHSQGLFVTSNNNTAISNNYTLLSNNFSGYTINFGRQILSSTWYYLLYMAVTVLKNRVETNNTDLSLRKKQTVYNNSMAAFFFGDYDGTIPDAQITYT